MKPSQLVCEKDLASRDTFLQREQLLLGVIDDPSFPQLSHLGLLIKFGRS